MLYSKIGSCMEGWQLGKVTSILQVLTCLVKLLVDQTLFLHLGQAYNPDSIMSIINFTHG